MIFGCTNSFSQESVLFYDSIANTFIINNNYAIGKEFCDFETISLNRDTITDNHLMGKITVVNFWFEGCAPCIAELEALTDLFNKYKNNISFQFLSFTVDNVEVAQKAVNKHNIPYIVCPVSRELAYKMNFNCGFPTNIVINKERKIVYFKSGGFLENEMIEKEFLNMAEVIAKLF